MAEPTDDPPSPYGPFSNPVDRFAHLPLETRRWLESLRQEDIEQLRSAQRFYATMMAVGKFNAWAIGIIVGTFLSAVAFGDAIARIFGWFKH